ncbi:MAG TPA: hypothetical protein PKV71_18190, partial [Calditrichia bacterium]|nr:hypothetical protein [Calditrichia bacterium]
MGTLHVTAASDPRAARKFLRAVLRDLAALEEMLERNCFETGVRRMGVEQELCLLDQFWHPAPVVETVLQALDDPQFTTELARFNLEVNIPPLDLTGNCFTLLSERLNTQLSRVREVMKTLDGEVVITGILPTIGQTDLSMDYLTPRERYHHLFKMLKLLRGGPFEYYIRGKDELQTRQEYPTFEFCNTSFQVHFQTDPASFVQAYNFSKMITGPVLAAAVNSPLLIGKRLWAETRIALFEQAIDTRNSEGAIRENRARVSFAREWVRDSILEIFQDDIARFRPLLLTEDVEDSLELLKEGKVPSLKALSVFSGTVYRWNRACYGVYQGKPHLRIENRVLPAGPTIADEVANAAFWLGLMNALPEDYRDLSKKFAFSHAVGNFVGAARSGMEARFEWLNNRQFLAADLIVQELLPMAEVGLKSAGVDVGDRDQYLGIVRERVESGKTGARWIVNNFEA